MKRPIPLITVLACLLLAVLAGCAVPQPTPATTASRHLGIYYRGTGGEVGHHMYATARGRCKQTWKASFRHLSGDLPPGLRFRGSRVEGTPTQPGVWRVQVKFYNVRCQGRPYGDEVVDINFNIKGYAPRRVQ